MAVVARITTLKFDDGSGNSRTFDATATVQDTAAGSSVAITITNTNVGLLPPNNPTTFTIRFVDDAGNIIRSQTLDNSATSQSLPNGDFFFTSTGLSGGSARCGTIEIKLQATRTGVGSYDYETDGSPSTAPTGFTATQVDRGWIRGTTTLLEDISNTSLGGSPIPPAQYDDSLFVRLVSGAVSYVTRALSVAISNTTPSLSANTNSTTGITRDVTFANVCDERFPAASTSVGLSVTVPNPTLATGSQDFTFTDTTEDTILVDPRLTCEHLFQLVTNTFSNPPLSGNDATGQRLPSDFGYLNTNLRTARGTKVGSVITGGINGLTVHTELEDIGSQVPAIIHDDVTGFNNENGWVNTFLQWINDAPGGSWVKTVTVTAPADINSPGYLINPTATYTLLAIDPNLRIIISLTAPNEGDHAHPGDTLALEATVVHLTDGTRKSPDVGTVSCTLIRYNTATSKWQYLEADLSTWSDWDVGINATVIAMNDEGDGISFEKEFTSTGDWTTSDIVASLVQCEINGTPYGAYVPRELVDKHNPHDKYFSVG